MKNLANRKAILITISLLFLALLIAITSFANAGINPEYWGSDKFIQDTMFTVSLVLIGIVCGQAEGDNYFRNKEKGLFKVTYDEYNKKRSLIECIV